MEKKAIILVAGMGSRLKPRTLTTHKCLTKVNGTPILINALSLLNKSGVKKTVLVVGYLGEEIKKEIGTNYNGMEIGYTENEIYADTNTSYSLKKGLEAVDSYDTLYILEGDVFFDEGLINRLDRDDHENITMVEAYEPRLDGTFVELSDDGFVVDWTHKSMREEGYCLEDKYKTINIHKFTDKFIREILYPCVDQMCSETQGKAPLENVMRTIVRERKSSIYGLDADGQRWFEIDDENELKIAEKMFRFKYRNAVETDYIQIKEIMKEIFDFNVTEQNYLEYMKDTNVEIIVAEDNESKEIAGVLCSERQWHHFAGYAIYYLRNCGVRERYRRNGIYATLIKMIKDKAKAEGIHAIELTAGMHRPDTHRFYLNNGFTIKKTLPFISEIDS